MEFLKGEYLQSELSLERNVGYSLSVVRNNDKGFSRIAEQESQRKSQSVSAPVYILMYESDTTSDKIFQELVDSLIIISITYLLCGRGSKSLDIDFLFQA